MPFFSGRLSESTWIQYHGSTIPYFPSSSRSAIGCLVGNQESSIYFVYPSLTQFNFALRTMFPNLRPSGPSQSPRRQDAGTLSNQTSRAPDHGYVHMDNGVPRTIRQSANSCKGETTLQGFFAFGLQIIRNHHRLTIIDSLVMVLHSRPFIPQVEVYDRDPANRTTLLTSGGSLRMDSNGFIPIWHRLPNHSRTMDPYAVPTDLNCFDQH
jgi:hypothetical protein